MAPGSSTFHVRRSEYGLSQGLVDAAYCRLSFSSFGLLYALTATQLIIAHMVSHYCSSLLQYCSIVISYCSIAVLLLVIAVLQLIIAA